MEFVNLLASKQGRQHPRRLRQPLTSIRLHADDVDDITRIVYQSQVTKERVDKVDRRAGFITRETMLVSVNKFKGETDDALWKTKYSQMQ